MIWTLMLATMTAYGQRGLHIDELFQGRIIPQEPFLVMIYPIALALIRPLLRVSMLIS